MNVRLSIPLDRNSKRKMLSAGTSAILLSAGVIVVLGFLSGIYLTPLQYTTPTPLFTINRTVTTSFANFIPYDESFNANAPQYSINPGLSNIANLNLFPTLTDSERTMIEYNGFVARPQTEFKQIYDILEDNKDKGIPSIVLSDSVLHAFHVLYDLVLRQIESHTYWNLINNLTVSMLNASYEQFQNAPEGRWKDAALRNVIYFSVAISLLNNETEIPEEAQKATNQVLSLIMNHEGFSDQWFQGYYEDFSQYVPRGHYTRTEILSHYFLAMMWYGRIPFRLIPSGDISFNDIGMNETAQAILMTFALRNRITALPFEPTGFDVWRIIYEPISFFVGSSDSLSPIEYHILVDEVYGSDTPLTILNNDTLLNQFIESAFALRNPLILSPTEKSSLNFNQTKGFSFFGQRYTPDAYILSQLVYSFVGVEGQPRIIPKGLDIMAALGSDRAWNLLDDEKHYYNYTEQMMKLRNLIGNIDEKEWSSNLYYLWIYSLLPLLTDPCEGYPMFMKSKAWVDKQLMTSLASWTELKHDTILYSKQSCTPIVPSEIEPVVGYVEPVPRLYGRLASLCQMMLDGLNERSLLNLELSDRLILLCDFLENLRAISLKEMNGTLLSDSEIKTIERSGLILKTIASLPSENLSSDTDDRMALIVDVHSDINTGIVLEESIGDPMMIFVVVYVDGEVIITRGGSFSYYEFTQPMSNRLTDEEWHNILDSGEAPEMPDWVTSFVCNTTNMLSINFVTNSLVESQNEWFLISSLIALDCELMSNAGYSKSHDN